MIKESEFQTIFLNEITNMLPGSYIMKNDANYTQGFPDWTVIYQDKALVFEIKRSYKSHRQPNQEYYIHTINVNGGFARLVYPENMEEILDEVQRTYEPGRATRISKSK